MNELRPGRGTAISVTMLKQTSLANITHSIFAANMFSIPAREFFVLYLPDLAK